MDKELKNKLSKIAYDVWEGGYAGSGRIPVQFMKKLSSEETKRIQELFKPEIEKELAKLHAMKKNDLNKNYCLSFMRIHTKVEGEEYESDFTLNDACYFKTVHGRRIHDIMPIEEILKENATSYYCKKGYTYSYSGCTENFKSLRLDTDGCYKRYMLDEIYQPGIQITRKNWGRAGLRNKFIKLVIDYVKQQEELGWKLVATEHEEYGSRKTRFDFEKAAA